MEEEKVVKKSTKRISSIDDDAERAKKTASKKAVKKSIKKTIEDVKNDEEIEAIVKKVKTKKVTDPKSKTETIKKKVSTETKKLSNISKESKSSPSVKKTNKAKVEKKAVNKMIKDDNELEDIFEKSSKEIKPKSKKTQQNKENTEKVKKISTKAVNKKADITEPETKKNTAIDKKKVLKSKSTAKKVSDKAEVVKRKITEEVTKASGESSSKIKINKDKQESKAIKSVKKANSNNNITKKANSKKDELKRKSTGKKEEDTKLKVENDEYNKKIDIFHVDDELEDKFDINTLDEELKKRKEISRDDLIRIIKKSTSGLIYAIMFIAFSIFVNYAFYNFKKTSFTKDLNIFAFIFLAISIMQIEASYKNEDSSRCINGIEILLMGIYTLVLPYISQLYNSKFMHILFVSGGIVLIYYIIKSIIIYEKNKRAFFRSRENIIKESYDIDPELDDNDEDDEI